MKLHRISSIPDQGSKGLSVKFGDTEIKVVVVRLGREIYCYQNACPHTGVNLDWTPDQFLDVSGKLIQCATHGALFQIRDGYCLSGPCSGAYLKALKVKIEILAK
jgi:nitrite reductase/ring-hydroxylating ferredoxin subunit